MTNHVHKCEPDELMRSTREAQVGKAHKLDLLKQVCRAGTQMICVTSWGHFYCSGVFVIDPELGSNFPAQLGYALPIA